MLDLFSALDWMMRLPTALQQRLRQDVDEIDPEKPVRYINTWEQRGIDKGIQQASTRLAAATPEQSRDWGDRVLDAASLDEVFGGH